jgi:hypothetical protein
VSNYRWNWRNTTDQGWTYSRVLYWRKFLEYYTIERPHLCLDEILRKNKTACGCNLVRQNPPHYAGNFWVSPCTYLTTLPPLNLTATQRDYEAAGLWFYEAAEMWLAEGYEKSRFVSLRQRKVERKVGLYQHWIQPSEYRFPEDLRGVSNVAL